MRCRFVLPPFLTLKNFEGLDLGKMDQVRVSLRVVCISVHFFSPTETEDGRRSFWRLQAIDCHVPDQSVMDNWTGLEFGVGNIR
jgi:hypothetical protein